MKRILTATLTATLVAVILAMGSWSAGVMAASSSAGSPLKVALVLAQGGLGDLSYNDLAYKGLEKAAKDFAGRVTVRTIQSADIVSQAEQVLRSTGQLGFDLVIDLEYSSADALARVAPNYPKTHFAIFNTIVNKPNVTSVMFQEQEGSFLAGALAAMVTSNPSIPGINADRTIGVIGGTKSLGIDKFIVGYIEGARYVDPKIKVLVSYSNTFGDPGKGKQMAQAMFEQGADIVYQVAGGTGQGVIEAAKASGHYAIGVDTDQDYLAPGAVLTSMIKRADVAVYTLIQRELVRRGGGGDVVNLGLAQGAIGLSPMTYTRNRIPKEYLIKLDAIKQGILAGSIKVDDITKAKDPSAIEAKLGLGK